jgi:colanic acid biosynthesis glycosyl transferase WcaI
VVSPARRIAHELSFGLVSALRVLSLPRADAYLVVSPPLVLGLFAWIVTTLKRRRFVLHVQDLQPDAAVGLGMLRHGWLVRALYGLERLAYAKAAVLSGISAGMLAAFQRKGIPEAKCALLPNWLRHPSAPPATPCDRAAARRLFGVADDTLLAFYAGNLGRKQGLEILLAAARLLAAPAADGTAPVTLLIAGDGAARHDFAQGLHANPGTCLRLLPLLDDAQYAALLRAADLALITQCAGAGQSFFPSKLLTVLAAGLPVVAVADADSELARAIGAGGFGCTLRPGDAAGLAATLRRLAAGRGQLAAWADRTDWVRRFAREPILRRFAATLQAVARQGTAAHHARGIPDADASDCPIRHTSTPARKQPD